MSTRYGDDTQTLSLLVALTLDRLDPKINPSPWLIRIIKCAEFDGLFVLPHNN